MYFDRDNWMFLMGKPDDHYPWVNLWELNNEEKWEWIKEEEGQRYLKVHIEQSQVDFTIIPEDFIK